MPEQKHDSTCICDRCEGIRRYPDITLCDWCGTYHNGDANNCAKPDENTYQVFPDDPPGTEQLCWDIFNAVKALTEMVKEKIDMIPRSTRGDQQTATGGRQSGRSGGSSRVQNGLPYLSIRNQYDYLTLNVWVPTKIIDCRVDMTARSPVTLKLAIQGKQVLWGLSTANPSLEALTDFFGDQENDWIGKTIEMTLLEDEFDGKVWPTVREVKIPKGKKD